MESTDRRRRLPTDVGAMLAGARRRRGWSIRAAAERAGISHGYLWMLEHAERAPSVLVASDLSATLKLDGGERATLMGHAVNDAGRCWRWQQADEREARHER